MPSTPLQRNDLLSKRLKTILQTSYDLEALALVGLNGDDIASALPPNIDAERFGSMALAAFSLSEQIGSELQRRALEQLFIRGDRGFIVLMPFDDQSLLVALARENAKPGLIILELQRAVKELLKK